MMERKQIDLIDPEKPMAYEKFSACIKERAGYKCEICGSNLNLEAHHKTFSFEGGKNTLNNGICLCRKCHKKFHGSDDIEKYKYLRIKLPINTLQELRKNVYINKCNKKLTNMSKLVVEAIQEYLEKHL
jgi:hypothetical protein